MLPDTSMGRASMSSTIPMMNRHMFVSLLTGNTRLQLESTDWSYQAHVTGFMGFYVLQ